MEEVKQGSQVDIEYSGRLEDGTLFDMNDVELAKKEGIYHEQRPYEPLHITVGEGMVIKGFEDALMGMKEGEEKQVKIKPEEGYGMPKDELVKDVPEDFFQGNPVEKGMVIMVTMEGQEVPAVVKEAGPKYALDFNHPLAGKVLDFKIKVLKIE